MQWKWRILIFSDCLNIRDVQLNCINSSENFKKFKKRKTITIFANFVCNFWIYKIVYVKLIK